jgi:hypothetical protein
MAIAELLRAVPPPVRPVEPGDAVQWGEIQETLGIRLPGDYHDFGLRYGSGYFEDSGRLIVTVWNPFQIDYPRAVKAACRDLRGVRHLRGVRTLPEEGNNPYGVFPDQPGWLPWGNDIDGNFLCWLTEGEPESWPIILYAPDRCGFQQLRLPMTTFLAKAFTRQLQLILWNDPAFFSGPEPVRFVPTS